MPLSASAYRLVSYLFLDEELARQTNLIPSQCLKDQGCIHLLSKRLVYLPEKKRKSL